MSFQQGLSGLNASSKNLDVIGHNIANANTVGFKASRAEFAEMVSSAIGTASGNDGGIGVEVADVAQQFTQGNLSITGNSLDVAINGNGFFTLTLPDGSPAYTRAGDFKLDKAGNKYIQQVAGTLLYYGQAVDITILPALSSIASEQAAPTEQTMAKVKQLLDYCASQEEAIITYNASKMVLAVHSDAGYANEKRQEATPGDISSYLKMLNPLQQLCHLNPCTNHQTCHVFSCQSRTRSTLHQCTGSYTTTTPSH